MIDGLPAVIGHRGAAALAPENTLAGFALAADLGCRMVEFDVRLSGDGIPIVFHDDTLDRCGGASGPVAARSLAELRHLPAAIPTLAETLALCLDRGLAVNIELKPGRGAAAATAAAALKVACALWPAGRPAPLLSSFSRPALAEAARLCPGWPRGLLVERPDAAAIGTAVALGCVAIHAGHSRLSPERIALVRAAGLAVLAYTVNRPARARLLLQRGISAVFSDHPDLLTGKSVPVS